MDITLDELSKEIAFQRNMLFEMQNRLDALETKRKKTVKGEFDAALALAEIKQAFLDTSPHQRKEPMTIDELVLWSVYVLVGTPRAQKLTSFAEFGRRKKQIQGLIAKFLEIAKTKFPQDGKTWTSWAHVRAKDYLEYVLTSVKIKSKKDVPEEFCNIYQACSDWVFNKYADKVASWQQVENLSDELPKESI